MRIWRGITAVVLCLAVAAGGVRAAGGAPSGELEKALKAIRARQRRTGAVHVSWTNTTTNYLEPVGSPPDLKWKHIPGGETHTEENAMWIKDSRARYESRPGKSRRETIYVARSGETQQLSIHDSGADQRAYGEVNDWTQLDGPTYMGFKYTAMTPISMVFRPFDPTIGLVDIETLDAVRTEDRRGHPCLVVRGRTGGRMPSPPTYVLWLAKDMDYLPIYCEELIREGTEKRGQTTIHYARRDDEWIPTGWSQVRFDRGRKNTVYETESVQVELKASIPDDHFTISYPDEARVTRKKMKKPSCPLPE